MGVDQAPPATSAVLVGSSVAKVYVELQVGVVELVAGCVAVQLPKPAKAFVTKLHVTEAVSAEGTGVAAATSHAFAV
jgi:hypothetical protein